MLMDKMHTAAADRETIEKSLPISRVVTFSGHLTDAPNRAMPRFPEGKTIAVARAIDNFLNNNGGCVHAVCSAARGSDLLFLEQVLERRGTATVILPFPASDFKKVSVGQGWDARFDAVLANDRVDLKPFLRDKLPPESEQGAAFEDCNRAIIKEAERLANQLDDKDPVLLTVWNGNPGDGQGGTAHAVSTWKAHGYRHENIDISKL